MILLSCKRLLALAAIFLACYLIAPSYLNAQALEKEWTLIRGIASEGMLCSELELGISEEHEGILILPEDAPVGKLLEEYF